jgi:hypothetical protein
MPETRSAVLLRKQAKKMRGLVEQGKGMDGLEGMEGLQQGVFRARSEEGKPKLIDLIKVSLIRPLRTFPGLSPSGRFSLTSYSIVIFFTLWISVAWAVFYGLTQSIPYVFRETYGFSTGRVGLVYLAMT